MIGHELGGRYEIITRIGSGGMALVYKAQDLLLNRNVAVKILRQQFVHDEEFIRRFRREAQSAASLSHPNVVSIYDVGQEDETHYIVMEYVEGSNLNEIIQERAPLQTEEAVRVAMQICDALEHAHQNQIIHRDIKPHNILIGKNGRVKVTDFGIARAVTSSTITQTGSVVGSVHYFSPEHAKGVVTGEKSDLYSLGIVLYQMLTAKLPFLGESPISVALKHLQDDFEEPRSVNPHIPQSVENIIIRSMRKNPGDRYASAREMLEDLETCLLPERLHEPKIAFTHDMDETLVMPAIKRGAEPVQGPPSLRSASASRTAETSEDNRWISDEPKKKQWVKPFWIVFSTLLVLALLFFGLRVFMASIDPGEVDVPYVVNKTLDQARQELAAKGLRVEDPVIYAVNPDVEKDIVFEQSKTNMMVKKGSFIKLYVSSGPEMATLDDFEGQSLDSATEALLALGLTKEQIHNDKVFNDQEPGTIISQTPAGGGEIDPAKAQVSFTVSKGKETIQMPNLVGLSEKDALQKLGDAGLKAGPGSGVVQKPSYEKVGTVFEQFPYKPNDPVEKGSQVTITVSSGLPEEAREYTFNISISPAQAGKTSEIRLVYSDARGDNIEWGKRKIKDTQTFAVKLVLSPNMEATVSVERDGQYVDTFPITYEQAGSGSVSEPASVAGNDEEPPANQQTPADQAGQTEGSGGNANSGQNQEQQQGQQQGQ
jgi:serine/threonine protein kinase